MLGISGEIKPSPVGPLHSRVIFAKLFVKSGNSLCDYKHHSENHLVCVVNISCVLDTRGFYSFSNVLIMKYTVYHILTSLSAEGSTLYIYLCRSEPYTGAQGYFVRGTELPKDKIS